MPNRENKIRQLLAYQEGFTDAAWDINGRGAEEARWTLNSAVRYLEQVKPLDEADESYWYDQGRRAAIQMYVNMFFKEDSATKIAEQLFSDIFGVADGLRHFNGAEQVHVDVGSEQPSKTTVHGIRGNKESNAAN